MNDPCFRRYDFEIVERTLRPFQELIAFCIAFKFPLRIKSDRPRSTGLIDLHRVVDDECDGNLRIDVFCGTA